MKRFMAAALILVFFCGSAFSQWKGGEGQNRIGTGLRDFPGADAGVWYLTGLLDWVFVENMAKDRAKARGQGPRWNEYIVRFMPEPPPLRPAPPPIAPPMDNPDRPRLGVVLQDYDDGFRRGMLVTWVREGSPATALWRNNSKWYLEGNVDVILEINDNPVTSIGSFRREWAQASEPIQLKVYDRNARKIYRYAVEVMSEN